MANAALVEALGPGDHACLTFTDPEERLDIVAAFVRDGLDLGHRVMCFTDGVPAGQLTTELTAREVPVTEPIRRGQLTVVDSDRSWLVDSEPAAARMIDLLATELDRADRGGYPGLRVTADMGWATRPRTGADELLVFESEVSKLFADGRLTAVCQYDRQSFDPVTLAFAARTHPHTVAAVVYHEDPVLRICRQHVPPGVRVAGEIDYRHAAVLEQALAECLRIDGDVHLNLVQLGFIDATVASVIVRAASNLPEPRRLTVDGTDTAIRMLTMLGAGELARLRVRVSHARD